MFETVLIAGRGVAALRALRTCARLRIKAVTAYVRADAGRAFVRAADDSVLIGPDSASALDIATVIEAAQVAGASAILPCGPLAQDRAAADAALAARLGWAGPVTAMSTGPVPAAGPGGLGDDIARVIVLGLPAGGVVTLGIIGGADGAGFAPMTGPASARVDRTARAAVEAADIVGVCTVWVHVADATPLGTSFVLPADHALVELITGTDLVEQALRIASRDDPLGPDELTPTGTAVARRITAGPLAGQEWRDLQGDGVRADVAYVDGEQITAAADAVIGTVAAWAPDRAEADERLVAALAQLRRRSSS